MLPLSLFFYEDGGSRFTQKHEYISTKFCVIATQKTNMRTSFLTLLIVAHRIEQAWCVLHPPQLQVQTPVHYV